MSKTAIALASIFALAMPGLALAQISDPTTEETLQWLNNKFEGIGDVRWYDYKERWYDKEDSYWYKNKGTKWEEVSYVSFTDRGELSISVEVSHKKVGLNDFDHEDVDWFDGRRERVFHIKDVKISLQQPADKTTEFEDSVKKRIMSYVYPDRIVELFFTCIPKDNLCMRSKSYGEYTSYGAWIVLPDRSIGERILKAFRHLQSSAEDKPKEIF